MPPCSSVPPIWNRFVLQPRLRMWDTRFATPAERELAREANRRAGWPDWLGDVRAHPGNGRCVRAIAAIRLVGRGSGVYAMRPHYPYLAAVYTLYFTGMRPSEFAALRVRDLEVRDPTEGGRLFVRGSRVLRREGPTKTATSKRVVAIDPTTTKILEPLVSLRANPDDFLFHAPEGGAIDQAKLNRNFCDAQRVLGIRIRALYSTKDTFCSLYLSRGGRLEWLAEQTGVAEGTLRKHYAKYIRTGHDDVAELAKLGSAVREAKLQAKTGEIVTRRPRASVSARKGSAKKMEQKGFES
jgi:integrase